MLRREPRERRPFSAQRLVEGCEMEAKPSGGQTHVLRRNIQCDLYPWRKTHRMMGIGVRFCQFYPGIEPADRGSLVAFFVLGPQGRFSPLTASHPAEILYRGRFMRQESLDCGRLVCGRAEGQDAGRLRERQGNATREDKADLLGGEKRDCFKMNVLTG